MKGKFTHKNFYKRFGSWNKALIKAGLGITVDKKISIDDLFDNLEAIWRKLGRQPYYNEIRKPFSRYVVDTYCRRFGGWHKACEAFVKYKGNNLEFIGCGQPKPAVIPRAINEKTRLKIFKRDNYSCVICGRSPASQRGVALHIDHIKPFSRGGDNSLNNLRALCERCNLGRGNDESL